jgi:hypothetical protein
VSLRGMAIMAAVCLIAGLIAVASGIGVGLAPVTHTFPTDKGILVADCGQPWPPRGEDPLFQFQPDVMAALEPYSPGMRRIKAIAMEGDCEITRTAMTNLMIWLGIGGVVLMGLGGVLVLLRSRQAWQQRQWPPVR